MHKFKTLLASALVMAASPVMAEIAGFSGWEYGPYIGIDVQLRHVKFPNDFGGNLFKKNYIQGNPFVGVRFNDFLGIEVGYEETVKKNATVINGPGVIEVNDFIPEGAFHYSNNFFRMRGANANIKAFIPFCVCDEKFDLLGAVGVSHLKTKLTHQITAVSFFGAFRPLTIGEMQEQKATFFKRRLIMRAMVGLQYFINCNVGVRATYTWENTKKFKNMTDLTVGNEIAKMKNSQLYGLGLFWQF